MNRIKNKLREWLFDDYWFRENFAKQIEFYMKSYVRDWISSNPEIIAPLIIKLITKEIKIKLKNK